MQGFVRDLDHPDHPLGGEDVDGRMLGKLQRSAQSGRSDLLVSADVTRPRSDSPDLREGAGGEAGVPGRQPCRCFTRFARRRSRRAGPCMYGAAVRLTAHVAEATTLTSLTAFRKLDFDNLVTMQISRNWT